MGKKWIYRLKKEDFANDAQRLNVTVDGRLEDMRKALSRRHLGRTGSDIPRQSRPKHHVNERRRGQPSGKPES